MHWPKTERRWLETGLSMDECQARLRAALKQPAAGRGERPLLNGTVWDWSFEVRHGDEASSRRSPTMPFAVGDYEQRNGHLLVRLIFRPHLLAPLIPFVFVAVGTIGLAIVLVHLIVHRNLNASGGAWFTAAQLPLSLVIATVILGSGDEEAARRDEIVQALSAIWGASEVFPNRTTDSNEPATDGFRVG